MKEKEQIYDKYITFLKKLSIMIEQIYYTIESKFPLIKILKNSYNKYFGPKRYKYLFEIIRDSRRKKIMEIGTWNGEHALQMIQVAKKIHVTGVEYYGFDLFELLDNEVYLEEVSKRPPTLKEVKNKLEKTGCKINLFQGDTRDILPKVVKNLPKMDFIFIDGGHSIETIENDWKCAQQLMTNDTVLIFDDYWNRSDVGCKKVIEKIDKIKFNVEILPVQDKFIKKWGILKINFVRVQKI